MAELGHQVRGVDLSAEMVRLARAKSAPFGAAIEVEQGDAGDPPFEPGSVDVVFARHILWTLPDPTEALHRWAALLRPGWPDGAGRGALGPGGRSRQAGPAVECRACPPRSWRRSSGELVGEAVVVQLTDSVFWGKDIEHERYLLRAMARGGDSPDAGAGRDA